MNKPSTAYRRRLKRKLKCGRSVKARLLEKFDHMLSALEEEYAHPTADQLEEGFGPPAHMAEILMNEVTPTEQAQYNRTRRAVILTACILVVAFISVTVYTYFLKDIPVVNYNESFTNAASVQAEEGGIS